MICQCKSCLKDRVWDVRIRCVPSESQGYFNGMYDYLREVEMDNDYYQAIQDGSWPNSVEILELWLENAKAKQKERDDSGRL